MIINFWSSLSQIIAAFLGTLGFALVFKLKGKYLLWVSLGGFCTYSIYILADFLVSSSFIAALAAATFVALLSEILARILKAPTVIFLTTISISIVPGSGLYYSMKSLLLQNWYELIYTFKSTVAIAAGIVCGIILVSAAFKMLTSLNKFHKKEITHE